MKNRIIDVFEVVNRLLVITVENPDFEDLRVNHTQRKSKSKLGN